MAQKKEQQGRIMGRTWDGKPRYLDVMNITEPALANDKVWVRLTTRDANGLMEKITEILLSPDEAQDLGLNLISYGADARFSKSEVK